jgi:hypothetical protein
MKHVAAVRADSKVAKVTPMSHWEDVTGPVFHLSPALHVATVACYIGFLGLIVAIITVSI